MVVRKYREKKGQRKKGDGKVLIWLEKGRFGVSGGVPKWCWKKRVVPDRDLGIQPQFVLVAVSGDTSER
jgi:hypothetical protein